MYLSHFGLRELPFSITPDPRFLYMSARHREALAHLVYGVGEHGGFVQLTGEVGTGKTSVCRCLLEQLPSHVDLALVLNPRLSPVELLATVCDELRIPYPAGTAARKELVDRLHRHLLEAHTGGRRTVLIVDEAQNLSPEVLEEVRLLTNLETAREKLLQVILIGQPELTAILDQPKLRQLAQRVTARYHLEPLSRAETRAYVRHRLAVAGRGRPVVHRAGSADAAPPVARHSRASSTPSPTAPCWAPTRGSAPGSMPRPCGARRPRCSGILRRRGSGGRDGPPPRRSLPRPEASALVLLVPGDIGRDEAGRTSIVSGPPGPSLAVSTAPVTGAAAMPAVQPSPTSRLAEVLRDPAIPATKGDALAVLLGLWGVQATGGQPGLRRAPRGGARVPRDRRWLAEASPARSSRRARARGPGGRAALRRPHGAHAIGGDASLRRPRRHRAAGRGGAILGRRLRRPLAAPAGELPVRRGARGPAADWLRQRMARAAGAGLPVESGRPYDQALWELVTAFQQARALEADGVVDHETAIVLRRRSGDPTCRGSPPG